MTLETQIQERAEAGDGQFAIAWSILRLTAAVRDLGTGNAASEMGAIEFLAAHLGEKIDSAVAQLAETIQYSG